MKRITLLLIFTLSFLIFHSPLRAQVVNIPDANLKYALLNHVPVINTNGDNQIQVSEAIAYHGKIDLMYADMSDMTGIEAFVNIKHLDCSHNYQLNSLNVSSLTNLDSLSCEATTVANLTLNTSLKFLDCWFSNLSSLNVNNLTSLRELYCGWNSISTLNVSTNTALKVLDCRENFLITNLNVSSNPLLERLDCSMNQLTAIDVSNNHFLKYLNISDNQISTLDLIQNSMLQSLDCSLNQISNLNLSANLALEVIQCDGNQLATLDVTACNQLHRLTCSGNQLSTISSVPMFMTMFKIDNNNLSCIPNLPYLSNTFQGNISNNSLTCVPNQTTYSLGLPLCLQNDAINNPMNCPLAPIDTSCNAQFSLVADATLPSVWYLMNQCMGSNYLSADSLQYTWSWGDSLNSTSTGSYPSFTYSSPGNYVICVTITDTITGCTSTYCDSSTYLSKSTANQMIQVNVVPSNSPLLTGLPHHLQGREEIQLYPNPTHNAITISSNDVIEQVLLIDLLGNEVMNIQNTSHKSTLKADVDSLPAGIYICKVNGKLAGKVVKE